MENNFEPNIQPVQPTQPAQPVQPVSPVQSSQPVEPVQPVAPVQPNPVFQPTQPAQPVQPFPPVNPATPAPKKNKGMMIALIGILAALVIVVIVVCVIAFMPKGGTSGSGNSTGGDSADSGDESGDSSNQASGSATIDSCPGCVFAYSNTMNAIVYSPNYTSKQYKSLSPNEYKTDWRDVIEETGHNVFLGLVLDEESRPNRAFACLKVEDSDPFCLEGLYSGEGGSSAIERSEAIKKNVNLVNNAFSINSEPNYETGITYQQTHGKSQAVVELESSSEKGTVTTYDENWVFCSVNYYGAAGCSDYWTK